MILKSLIIIIQLLSIICCYKLNVPKVLLPFHSSNAINFTLELINDEEDDSRQQQSCFSWSSSRPEIVSIEPIYEIQNELKCSRKAIVSSISKYPQRLTSNPRHFGPNS